MKRFRPIVYLFLFLCYNFTPLYAENSKAILYYISWDAIDGAGGYLFEVQSTKGELVICKQLDSDVHEMTINLPAGLYQFKITTLNRLMRIENATDWISFEVISYSAPVFIKLTPSILLTGKPFTLTVEADKMNLKTTAYLVSPSGRHINLAVKKIRDKTFELSGESLTEVGKYSLGLKNTEILEILQENILLVKYPDPVPTKISPERILVDNYSTGIIVSGTNFSPEVSLAYAAKGETDLSKCILFVITKKSKTSITAEFPSIPVSGNYCLFIANSNSDIKKETLSFEVLPPVINVQEAEPAPESILLTEAPPPEQLPVENEKIIDTNATEIPVKEIMLKQFKNRIALGAGTSIDMYIDKWGKVYQGSQFSHFIFCDLYLTNNLFPKQGVSFDFALGLRTDIHVMETAENSIYVRSALTTISTAFNPSLTLSMPYGRIRFYAGGGFCYTSLEYSSTGSVALLNTSSLDPCVGTGLFLEFPLNEFLSIGIASHFTYLYMTEPSNIYIGYLLFSILLPKKE